MIGDVTVPLTRLVANTCSVSACRTPQSNLRSRYSARQSRISLQWSGLRAWAQLSCKTWIPTWKTLSSRVLSKTSLPAHTVSMKTIAAAADEPLSSIALLVSDGNCWATSSYILLNWALIEDSEDSADTFFKVRGLMQIFVRDVMSAREHAVDCPVSDRILWEPSMLLNSASWNLVGFTKTTYSTVGYLTSVS